MAEAAVPRYAWDCDVCGLPDPYRGTGDGIGSCDCPRCECGEAAHSQFCTCEPEGEWGDDERPDDYDDDQDWYYPSGPSQQEEPAP